MVSIGKSFAAAVGAVLCTATVMVGLVGSAEAAAPSVRAADPQAAPRDPDQVVGNFGWSYECEAYRQDTIRRVHPSYVSKCYREPGGSWYYVYRR